MAVRPSDWTPNEVLKAVDLNDTFASKLDLAGGKILQIVRATDNASRTTTSTSFVDITGLSVTITPQKSDSAILLVVFVNMGAAWTTGDDGRYRLQITDSSNNGITGAEDGSYGTNNLTKTGQGEFRTSHTLIGYSTPATTSAVTYKARFRSQNADVTTEKRTDATSSIYAIEVSA